jgi:hypothetical protein
MLKNEINKHSGLDSFEKQERISKGVKACQKNQQKW